MKNKNKQKDGLLVRIYAVTVPNWFGGGDLYLADLGGGKRRWHDLTEVVK